MSAHAFTVYDMLARGAAVHGGAPAVIQGERHGNENVSIYNS